MRYAQFRSDRKIFRLVLLLNNLENSKSLKVLAVGLYELFVNCSPILQLVAAIKVFNKFYTKNRKWIDFENFRTYFFSFISNPSGGEFSDQNRWYFLLLFANILLRGLH